MYFVRLYGSGLDKNSTDPRHKIWAEYKCGLCGEITDIDVTSTKSTFDFKRDRRCPHCKQINAEDRKQNLKAQLDKLTADKSRIEVEIEQIERELSQEIGEECRK